MKLLKLNTVSLQIYSSIKEIPIELSKKMQLHLLKHEGIGSDLKAFYEHLDRVQTFIEYGKSDFVHAELQNLYLCSFLLYNSVRYDVLAFLHLVKSVDRVPIDDYSEAGLTILMEELGSPDDGLTSAVVEDTLQEITTYFKKERQIYFPDVFYDDLNQLDYYRRYVKLQCDNTLNSTAETRAELKAINEYFIDRQKPYVFNPHDQTNIIKTTEEALEEVLAVMEENGVMNPRTLTEYQFYQKLKYYERKYKKLNG